MVRFLALLLMASALASCASVLGHSTQEVTFETPGAYDSVCLIDNGEIIYRAWPPQTITLSKRNYDLKVRCLADGNREKTVVIEPDSEPLALGNVATGVAPGLFIDHSTGALYAYPSKIVVDFSDIPPRPMLRPNYDYHLADNPELYGMEEFRPGDAALSRDKYDAGYELKKKENPGSSVNFNDFTSVTEGGQPASETEGPAPASGSSPASEDINGVIDSLTREMNPQVFGPTSMNAQQSQDSFAGGTSAGEEQGPVMLHPSRRQ